MTEKEKPSVCADCPCKPTRPESDRNLLRSKIATIIRSGGFPCHTKHPDSMVLHDSAIGEDGLFHTPDCVGYKLWPLQPKRNMK
jgi:hypothetical protein